MVGAALDNGRPATLEDNRLTVEFPGSAAFSKKKAESNRGLLQTALRGLTGHSLELLYDNGGEDVSDATDATLSEDELLERLKQEFGATEVFDDPEERD
jgi:hypothetical protein